VFSWLFNKKEDEIDESDLTQKIEFDRLWKKVLDDLKHNFDEWVYSLENDCYKRDKIEVTIMHSSCVGYLEIDDASWCLSYNHYEQFMDLYYKLDEKKRQDARDKVLEEWGCK
jgi:hypothetical protein